MVFTNLGICSVASLNVLTEIVSLLLALSHTLSHGISEDKLTLLFLEQKVLENVKNQYTFGRCNDSVHNNWFQINTVVNSWCGLANND